MIGKEAIKILGHQTNLGYGVIIEGESTKKIEKALDMATKSLKALETIKKEIEHLEISGDYGKGVMDCYEIIIKAKEEVENV